MVILGDPIAKGRPKFFRRGGFVGTYTPDKTRRATDQVKIEARQHWKRPVLDGPVRLEVAFAMPRPKSMSKSMPWEFHIKRPDLDNLEKLVMDALNGICWKDDSQVCQKTSRKYYDQEPKIVITITSL